MVTILDPNSTPMVKSCTHWNLLSVNCNNRHDFPTPEVSFKQDERERERVRRAFFMISRNPLLV